MKFKLELERHYPHSITDVWEGIASNEGISDWLLDTNNFKAVAGHQFDLTCVNEDGSLDVYRCQILEIDPPTRMLWSWVLAGKESEGLTEVEFRLKATDTGTTVTLIHRGDRDKATIDRFKSGWPYKLDRLAETLANRAASKQ